MLYRHQCVRLPSSALITRFSNLEKPWSIKHSLSPVQSPPPPQPTPLRTRPRRPPLAGRIGGIPSLAAAMAPAAQAPWITSVAADSAPLTLAVWPPAAAAALASPALAVWTFTAAAEAEAPIMDSAATWTAAAAAAAAAVQPGSSWSSGSSSGTGRRTAVAYWRTRTLLTRPWDADIQNERSPSFSSVPFQMVLLLGRLYCTVLHRKLSFKYERPQILECLHLTTTNSKIGIGGWKYVAVSCFLQLLGKKRTNRLSKLKSITEQWIRHYWSWRSEITHVCGPYGLLNKFIVYRFGHYISSCQHRRHLYKFLPIV